MTNEMHELVVDKVNLELEITRLVKQFEDKYDHKLIIDTIQMRRLQDIGGREQVRVKVDVWVNE